MASKKEDPEFSCEKLSSICCICEKDLKTLNKLQAHGLTTHEKQPIFFCKVPGCGSGFSRYTNLYKHQTEHHGRPKRLQPPSSELTCGTCGFRTRKRYQMNAHVRLVHGDGRRRPPPPSGNNGKERTTQAKIRYYSCKRCWKTFPNRKELKNHGEKCANNGTDNFVGRMDSTTTATATATAGGATCSKDATGGVKVTGVIVKNERGVNSFVSVTAQPGEREMKASEKVKMTKPPGANNGAGVHALIDMKPHVCQVCGKIFDFDRLNAFKLHQRLHMSLIACPICGGTFRKRVQGCQRLINHVRDNHPNEYDSVNFDDLMSNKYKFTKANTSGRFEDIILRKGVIMSIVK